MDAPPGPLLLEDTQANRGRCPRPRAGSRSDRPMPRLVRTTGRRRAVVGVVQEAGFLARDSERDDDALRGDVEPTSLVDDDRCGGSLTRVERGRRPRTSRARCRTVPTVVTFDSRRVTTKVPAIASTAIAEGQCAEPGE